MSGARQRKMGAGRQGGYEHVEATSRYDQFPKSGDSDARGVLNNLLHFAGHHETPPIMHIVYALSMEVVGSFLVGFSVALASWRATSGGADGASYLAALYGLSYFVGTRFVKDYVLRRHLSGAITAGYVATGELGLPGFFFYTLAQYLGGMLAGGMVAGLLKGATDALPRSPVPIPVVTGNASSLTTVICLELFGSAIYVFALLLNEFLNTNPKQGVKNFNKASFITSLVIAVEVALCFQFQVYTMNNVAYFGGFFGGINAATDWRDIVNLGSLGDVAIYPGSVFASVNGGAGGAAALYLLMPYVGGLLGAAIFWAFFMLRADEEGGRIRTGLPKEVTTTSDNRLIVKSDDGGSIDVQSNINRAGTQTKLTDLVSPLMQH